ncbi:hypothetical protein [uncultured Roseobacter sp.]|uniref:hypothetical protein n=1 Tax=uncultured Roseobacter sp. TaxID=114847 RepID=UPI002619D5A3|nr:hypothetical protein [uncultured Roseobacter sp.]
MIVSVSRLFLPIALGAALAAIILTAAWPALGPAWHIATPWASSFVSPSAQWIWFLIAVAAFIAAWRTHRAWSGLLAVPLLGFAITPPQMIDLSTDLLARSVALEARMASTRTESSAAEIDAIASDQALQTAIAEEMVAVRDIGRVFDSSGLDEFVGYSDFRRMLDLLKSGISGATEREIRELQTRLPDQAAARDAVNSAQESLRQASVAAEACDTRDFGREALNSGDLRFLRGDNNIVARSIIRQMRERCVTETGVSRNGAEVSLQRAIDRRAEVDVLADEVLAEISNANGRRAILANSLAARSVLQDAQSQARLASATLIVSIAITLAAATAVLVLREGHIVVPAMLASVLSVIGIALWYPAHSNDELDLSILLYIGAAATSATAILLTVRVVRLYALANRHLWYNVPKGEVRTLLARTAVQCLPLIAILIGVSFATDLLWRHMTNPLYADQSADSEMLESRECDVQGRLLFTNEIDGSCTPRSLERDTERAVRYHFETIRRNAIAAVEDGGDGARSGTDWAANEAGRIFQNAIPNYLSVKRAEQTEAETDRGLNRVFDIEGGCRWWHVRCRLSDGGKSFLDNRYQRARAFAESQLTARLEDMASEVDSGSAAAEAAVTEAVEIYVAWLRAETDRAFWVAFRYADVTYHIAVLVLIAAIFKSFGYVYLRNVYRVRGFNKGLMSSTNDVRKLENRVITAPENGTLNLSLDDDALFVGSFANVKSRQVAASFRPAPTFGLFLRGLLTGWTRHPTSPFFRRYRRGDGSFILTTGMGRRLCAVRLLPGEVFVFRPHTLVGFSSGVRIRACWRFGPVDLLLNKLRRPVATGGGWLILRLDGEAIITEGEQRSYVESETTVIWSASGSFGVRGEGGIWATYFGGTSIAPTPGGMVIGDAGLSIATAAGLRRAVMLMVPV